MSITEKIDHLEDLIAQNERYLTSIPKGNTAAFGDTLIEITTRKHLEQLRQKLKEAKK